MAVDVPVLVVGAGPTGLLLAAELFRHGVACRLVDAHAGPMHWDRATIVHPRSLEIFEALGIVEPFLATGVKQKMARLHSDGGVLGDIDLALCGSRYGFNIGISEETTEAILTDYLHRQGGDVMRSAKLVGLRTGDEHVTATIERDGTTEELTAGFVVGCDGVHSTTRELAGITMAGHEIAAPWAVFDVTLTGWAQSYEGIYAYLDQPVVILTSLPGERWRVYLRPTSPESDLVADAVATLARYHPMLAFDDVENPTRFHCHTKVATRFRAGRVLIAGDAAHVCSPAQGHGMNSGLQDAFNLAWKLALVCSGDASPTLLDSYEAERRPVAEMITASGDEAERAHALTDPADRRARDESLRAVFTDATTRHHEAVAEAELDITYGDSPIVMGDRHARLGPGDRLPDTIAVRDADDGERYWLHLLGFARGHAGFLIGGAAAGDGEIARVLDELEGDGAVSDAAIIVGLDMISTRANEGWNTIDPADAEALGIDGVTLLVVRPDGHIGLRADRDHRAALDAYCALIAGIDA